MGESINILRHKNLFDKLITDVTIENYKLMTDNSDIFFKIPNYEEVAKKICRELDTAAKGEKSPLSFHKIYLLKKPLITNGIVQAIVIGGTNFEFATVKVKEGKREILKIKKGKLAPLNSIHVFNELIDKNIETELDGIAVNFGFPLSYIRGQQDLPDAKIIMGVKEHSFHGLIGHQAGPLVQKVYEKKTGKRIPVAVANDGICLTLDDASLIVGTGLGMGIRGTDKNGPFIAAPEPGDSEAFETTEELEEIDRKSANRGIHRFEKMVSGKYLPVHFNLLSKKHGISYKINTAEELSAFAAKKRGVEGELARAIIDRSARYVAALLAGVYEFSGSPKKYAITIEGSLLLHGFKYKESLQEELINIGVKEGTITLRTLQDSSVLGAVSLLS